MRYTRYKSEPHAIYNVNSSSIGLCVICDIVCEIKMYHMRNTNSQCMRCRMRYRLCFVCEIQSAKNVVSHTSHLYVHTISTMFRMRIINIFACDTVTFRIRYFCRCVRCYICERSFVSHAIIFGFAYDTFCITCDHPPKCFACDTNVSHAKHSPLLMQDLQYFCRRD